MLYQWNTVEGEEVWLRQLLIFRLMTNSGTASDYLRRREKEGSDATKLQEDPPEVRYCSFFI